MIEQQLALTVAGIPIRRARAGPPIPRGNKAYDTRPQTSVSQNAPN